MWLCLVLALPGFGQWRLGYLTQFDQGSLARADVPWSKYTHIVHSSLEPQYEAGKCVLGWSSTEASDDSADELVRAAHAHGVAALIGISEDERAAATKVCTSPEYINLFVGQIAGFVREHGYDGVDFSWRTNVSGAEYQQVIAMLRAAMPDGMVTTPVEASALSLVAPVQEHLDQINVATGGLRMPAQHRTGVSSGADEEEFQALLAEIAAERIAPARIGIAVPLHGDAKAGCLASGEGGTEADESGTFMAGSAEQEEDCPDFQKLREAARRVRVNQLGGIMTYSLLSEMHPGESGDGRYPLSTAMQRAISVEFGVPQGTALAGPARAYGRSRSTAPSVATASPLPSATAGQPYSSQLTASGARPIVFRVSNGLLPIGLALSASGAITGTPTSAGSVSVTIEVRNAAGVSTKVFTLYVNAAPPPTGAAAPRFGMNLSGAEYSWGDFASERDIAYLKSKGITIVRVPIAWERMQPSLNGPLSASYLQGLKSLLATAAAYGVDVIVDLHNYGRYNAAWGKSGNIGPGTGNVIGSAALPISAFADLWKRIATALKGTPGLAYYDIMNEPHAMGDASAWPAAAQAAVNGIRAVDRDTTILVEGTGWASARWWVVNNNNLRITDPVDKLVYEAHLYFDEDGSATYPVTYAAQGAYPNIGVDRVQPFLTWLQQNNARGFIGEFGIPGDDPLWLPVLDHFLSAMQKAGISGTYWLYQYHSGTDPAWWPSFETMGIYPDKNQGAQQLGILMNSNPK